MPSMALAFQAAFGCAKWLSCHFVELREFSFFPYLQIEKEPHGFLFYLAEGERFELSDLLQSLVFKTSAFSRSATPPEAAQYYLITNLCQSGILHGIIAFSFRELESSFYV